MYGTLGLDAVVECLIDRVPSGDAVTAPGWRAARLPDKPYPGLVADACATAAGQVFTDLGEDEWATLDAFEDPMYTLTPVDLSTGRRGLAYVWPNAALPETWTVDSLDAEGMAEYLNRVRAWRDRYEASVR